MNNISGSGIRHIVTGSDGNYLHRALLFYRSLSKVHSNFILHIFCFDDVTHKILTKLRLQNVIFYHPEEFENAELLQAKASKERMYEYFWTINPYMAKRTLSDLETDFISLSDCDLYFYQSPEVIFEELKGADVLIQPNNFSFQYENDFVTVGYYCTSFQCFRKNENSHTIIDDWYRKCLQWCSSKFEDGKFGEQKYLDDWRIRFDKVREISNIGTNVAPWNIQKYDLSMANDRIVINNKWPLVYYHFHSFRMSMKDYSYIITGDRNNSYPIQEDAIHLLYEPYIKEMKQAIIELKEIEEYRAYININPHGDIHYPSK